MGYRLHQPQVAGEGVFDQILPVAGDGGALDFDLLPAQPVDLPELFQGDGHGIALVGVVIGVEQPAVRGDEDDFCGGGARVNT